MEHDLYTFVQTRMRAFPLKEWQAIADEAGVNYATAYRYAYGYTPRPSHDPLMRLAAALKARST